MLFEPGPLSLFTDAEIPRALSPPRFEALAAREAAELQTGAHALDRFAGALAPAVGAPADLAAATDLIAAATEHDRQSREADSAIAGVAAGAGALQGTLAGLSNELARELADASLPDEPDEPDAEPNEDWMDPEYGDIINEWFEKFLGREAPADHITDLRDARARLVDVLAGILSSDEYLARQRELLGGGGGGPLPTPTPGGGGGGGGGGEGEGGGDGDVIQWALLRTYADENPNERSRIEAFLRDNPGDDERAPSALDLPGWDDFIARQ